MWKDKWVIQRAKGTNNGYKWQGGYLWEIKDCAGHSGHPEDSVQRCEPSPHTNGVTSSGYSRERQD